MIKSIIVIGVGSLGGHIVNSLSNLDNIEKIAIIDDDIVEEKNIINSIYRYDHIGRYKINCLKEIINQKRNDISIQTYNCKYIEGETLLPNDFDLILDCRDMTYNRNKEIDCRLYISSRYLIVDCRNDIIYEKQNKGKYITQLKKSDLRNASNIFSSLIDNNIINDLIFDKNTTKFDLDYYKKELCFKEDLIYDCNESTTKLENKITNLPNQINPIIESNKINDLKVCLGSIDNPTILKEIENNSITNINDLTFCLNNIINDKNEITCSFHNYIIYFNQINNIIEIVPETGAA